MHILGVFYCSMWMSVAINCQPNFYADQLSARDSRNVGIDMLGNIGRDCGKERIEQYKNVCARAYSEFMFLCKHLY